MKPVQFFLLAFALFALVKVIQHYRERGVRMMKFATWILLWIGAVVVIIFPDTTNFFAEALGVWRGADLVLYASVLIIFYLIFRIHLALGRLHQEITEVVRAMALEELPSRTGAVTAPASAARPKETSG